MAVGNPFENYPFVPIMSTMRFPNCPANRPRLVVLISLRNVLVYG